MKIYKLVFVLFVLSTLSLEGQVRIKVLGTTQDAGFPQLACLKSCCSSLSPEDLSNLKVASLGVLDKDKSYLMDASPDIAIQWASLNKEMDYAASYPDGVFLTHAHIGHYTGLMYFGREAMGASKIPVYSMPKMQDFLKKNGPWSQLVELNNIVIKPIFDREKVVLSESLSITPLIVPHRDEFSETVGFLIQGSKKSALFIPDIDKWSKWNSDILDWISKVDYAFLDATFYDQKELPNRDMSTIPHPFVIESMSLFDSLDKADKNKIYFIHLNHTNPLLNEQSSAYQFVEKRGFHIAKINTTFDL
jgi:pyrroloquinoline quinone biosynthesis protein B